MWAPDRSTMTSTPRTRRVALCCVAAVALATAACSSTTTTADPPPDRAKTAAQDSSAYLFVFDGRDAEAAPVPGEPGSFTLTVPITLGNELVTWFTDRPVRDAGHMTMASFVDLWKDAGDDSFTADPPNVAMSFDQTTVVATMTAPRIDTTPDGAQSLVTTMTVVKGKALEQLAKSGKFLAAHAERAQGTTLPGAVTLPSVSVFVDDSTVCSGWQQCCQKANSAQSSSCTVTRPR